MKIILFPARVLYSAYALATFIVLMLGVTPFVVIGSFFGRIRGGNFIFRVCNLWGDAWFFLIGIWHKNHYEEPFQNDQHYIFVANHISYLDAPVIAKSIRQPIRVLGKIEMSRVPIFGYIYQRAIVTVDRSSPANRANSVRILKSILNKNISIFIFPEGTFNMSNQPLKEFYDGAFRIAIETQTPIKPVLFLDAYDRMHFRSMLSLNPGQSRSIFLESIPVDGLTLKDTDMLKQQVYTIMEQKLIQYKASWIPSS